MDIEELAKKMRERAIKIEQEAPQREIDERIKRQGEIELIQKLYFNAGRWAGGARDRTAKEAFQRVSLGG